MTTTSEFLKFGAKLGWVSARVPGLLSQPKYVRYAPPGFDAGERDQFGTVRWAVRSRGSHLHVIRRINENGALAKSRYPRTIPVSERMVDAYADYQFERDRFDRTGENDAVFVNLFREPRG